MEQKTSIRIGPVRLSFPVLFVPKAFEDGGEPKYGASFLLHKTKQAKTIAKIEKAIKAAQILGKTKCPRWKGKIPPIDPAKHALRDGDEMRPDDPAYQNMMVLVAKCKTKPGTVLKDGTPASAEDLFSGCLVYATLNIYPYDKGGKGVTAGLNNVLFWEDDGKRFDGRSSASVDFGDIMETDDEDNDSDNDDDEDLGF